MATTYKAQSMSRELADLLRQHVAATLPVVVETFDSDGNPVITLSADATPTTGEKIVVVRTKMIANPDAKDILGNAAIQFTPHVIQLCTEANYAATSDNIADILTPVELLPILTEIGRKNAVVEWYVSANGTAPTTTQMTAANLKATWRNLYWNVLTAS